MLRWRHLLRMAVSRLLRAAMGRSPWKKDHDQNVCGKKLKETKTETWNMLHYLILPWTIKEYFSPWWSGTWWVKSRYLAERISSTIHQTSPPKMWSKMSPKSDQILHVISFPLVNHGWHWGVEVDNYSVKPATSRDDFAVSNLHTDLDTDRYGLDTWMETIIYGKR